MSEVRIIKRYSNRKLYDLAESRYVTLQEVAAFLEAGHEVQIVDNKTKEDITSVTMAQILYEQERAKKSGLPLGALKDILLTSSDLLQKRIATPVKALRGEAERTVSAIREEAEKKVTNLREQAGRQVGRFLANQREMGEEAKAVVTEVTHATQAALDDFTRSLDERFKQMIRFPRKAGEDGDDSAAVDRLAAIEAKLDELGRRLESLESRKTNGRKK